MYTIDDYQKAVADAQRWSDALDRYSGNNPNKYQADLREARQRVRIIKDHLKDAGVLPLTDQEALERELDRAFPDAQSKQIVEYRRRRYRRRFFPLEESRSRKTVTEWGREWEPLKD